MNQLHPKVSPFAASFVGGCAGQVVGCNVAVVILLLKNIIKNRSLITKSFYSTKPFYYQELFEHANLVDVPYKKLTGKKNIILFFTQI